MSISNYLENKLLDAVFNATAFNVTGDPYISLHTADPGETGASEVTGGSYARQQAAFGEPPRPVRCPTAPTSTSPECLQSQ